VVAPDLGAVRCIVHPGEDGELMVPGDVDSLVEAVSALVEHPATAARLADAGRLLAESEYAWPLLVDRWDDMLGAIVADRRPVPAGTA
jgi:glycosyltransferase involved in cell wall biosynthesis